MGLVKRKNPDGSLVIDYLYGLESTASSDTSIPEPEQLLLERLANGGVEQRRTAAQRLVGHRDSLSEIVSHLMRESDLAVRSCLFNTLIHTPGIETAKLLIGLLRSEDTNLRNEAIEALSTMPDDVEPLMTGMIQDPDPDIRIFAINVMATIKHFKVVDWLIAIVSTEKEVNVSATAIDLLSEVGDKRCLPALKSAQVRFADEPYVDFVVDLAIMRINDELSKASDHV